MTSKQFIKWFDTFLDEKKLPYQVWDIDTDQEYHLIDSEVVIESIKNAPIHEQVGIKNTIIKIDFANGDVNHFFKHLACGLVNNY